MIARLIAVYLALAAGIVSAQSDSKPEIRGTVTDPSLNIGVAGAEITLFEFLLDADKTVVRTRSATTATDTRGEFRFLLQHFGEYFVEAKKEGYSVPVFTPGGAPPSGTSARADVDRDHPKQDLRFWLSLPGDLVGQVVDEDGNPVAGLRVGIQNRESPIPEWEPGAVTNQDGSFTTRKLPAGQYLIRISPKAADFETVTAQFSEDDLKIVDQDFDPAAIAPVPVSPGASSSAGTITVRKVPYYRAHLSIPGVTCQAKENWMFSVMPRNILTALSYSVVPCGSELLVRNLKPGSYWFALRSMNPGVTGRWALAEVDITSKNVEVPLAMTQTAVINGRIIAAEGATLPKFDPVRIMMRARLGNFLKWAATSSASSEGKFAIKDLPLLPHDVSVGGLDGRYYIKEVRYNNVVMADGKVKPAPGQILEIVLDDKSATITGSVRDGDKPVSSPLIVAVKWPFAQGDVPISGESLTGDKAGRFQISGLAPGEYRVMALTKVVRFTELLGQLLIRAEKVVLDRGGLKDVSLKLVDPSR